jgi:hypothetical protein
MMLSKHKLKVKRQKRRARAMARAATVAAQQPIAAQPTKLNGGDILKYLDNRFDELLGPRTLKEALVGALVSQS